MKVDSVHARIEMVMKN
nr:unnamed protein product [Callosobruchus chinensis]